MSESLQYADFSRVTQAGIAGVGSKTWSYDSLGNLTAKDGYTDYEPPSHPRQPPPGEEQF